MKCPKCGWKRLELVFIVSDDESWIIGGDEPGMAAEFAEFIDSLECPACGSKFEVALHRSTTSPVWGKTSFDISIGRQVS